MPQIEASSPAVQARTGKYIQHVLSKQLQGAEKSTIGVFDNADIQDSLHSADVPPVLGALVKALPDRVTMVEGAASQSVSAMVLDAVAHGIAKYKREHGREPQSWVIDDALRSTLPMVSAEYAESMKMGGPYMSRNQIVFDDASSVSGGAMAVSQTLTAVYSAFSDSLPFSGRIAMGEGLEGRIIVVGHRAARAVGGYAKEAILDGLQAGKPFMKSQRYVEAVETTGKWDGVVKLSDTDASGSAIIPSTVNVLVNGLLMASADPGRNRSEAPFAFGGNFGLNGTNYTVQVNVTPVTGVVDATFSPALPVGSIVEIGASIDFENEALRDKRPMVESFADVKSIRAGFSSGLFRVTQEANMQWNTEVRLDPISQNLGALRVQNEAERHALAIERMHRIATARQFDFVMNKATRLDERSLASILVDMGQTLDEANLDMIARTNLNSIGVMYVGATAASYYGSLGREVFEPSGIAPRAGTYRIGRLFGKYDLYYSPSKRLEANSAGWQILCIGTSNQVGANPYITGTALGTVISPLNVNDNGEAGQFYFEAGVDSVNPHVECAQSACIVNVKF